MKTKRAIVFGCLGVLAAIAAALALMPDGSAAAEARDYALREAASGDLAGFAGGHDIVVYGGCACIVLGIIAIVILI